MATIETTHRLGFRVGGNHAAATPATIPQALDASARRFGHKVAFQEKAGREFRALTYQELHQRAADFGAGLIALGLRHGDRVAIVCENSLDWVVAYMGQSMAGGVGVPLYTELKGAELDPLLEQADVRFVVTSDSLLPKLIDHMPGAHKVIVTGLEAPPTDNRINVRGGFLMWHHHAELLPFDQVAARATSESRLALADTQVGPNDLASLVYTSGTTGGMKGVMLTHRNILANVRSMRGALSFDERDSLLLVLPLHHTFSFTVGVVTPMVCGVTVTFENDLLRVRERLAECRPTVFLGVPALYDLMMRAIRGRIEGEGRGKTFERGLRLVDTVKRRTGVNIGRNVFRELHSLLGGKLRFMFSGGAALNPQTQLQYLRLGIPLLQGWGLTEAAPGVSVQRFWPRRFLFTNYYERHVGSVGQPLPGVEVKLIDVPEKEIFVHLHGEGELVVRGENVTLGYWKAEAATARIKLGEWLRTGDLGRFDEEGNIYITGRSKYVIVLESGEKVHPDELEELMATSSLIDDIAVVGRKVKDKTQVWAIVYPNYADAASRLQADSAPPAESAVQDLVAGEIARFEAQLAPYKRLSRVVLTDQPLPKNALRKVLRERLAEDYSFEVKRWADGAPAPPGQ